MLQFKIPQNVQREDQILSFLTMRQLIIIGVGGGICYMLFISLSKTFFIEVWGIIILFPMLLTIAVAFIKINGVSFTKYALLILEYQINPKKRVWNNKQTVINEINALMIHSSSKKQENTQKQIPNNENKEMKTFADLINHVDMSSLDDISELPEKKKSVFIDKEDLFDDEDDLILKRLHGLSK